MARPVETALELITYSAIMLCFSKCLYWPSGRNKAKPENKAQHESDLPPVLTQEDSDEAEVEDITYECPYSRDDNTIKSQLRQRNTCRVTVLRSTPEMTVSVPESREFTCGRQHEKPVRRRPFEEEPLGLNLKARVIW
ncbi:hypothetical protein ACHAPJ_001896 [Fusarium lateritium]